VVEEDIPSKENAQEAESNDWLETYVKQKEKKDLTDKWSVEIGYNKKFKNLVVHGIKIDQQKMYSLNIALENLGKTLQEVK
jgi:hypothetical protein